MTVHVLDTGAVLVLLNKHKPRILSFLKSEDEKGFPIWIPTPVLIELGQGGPPNKKRLERIYEIANVRVLDQRIAQMAGDLLNAVNRERCPKCSGFIRPTLVDAVVMAFADDWATAENVVVHTQDVSDLEALNTNRRVEVVAVDS